MTNEQKPRPEPGLQPKETLTTAMGTEQISRENAHVMLPATSPLRTLKRQPTSSGDTSKRPKSNRHAPSSPVTESKLREKQKEYLEKLSQELQDGVPQDDHEAQTPSPPPLPQSPRLSHSISEMDVSQPAAKSTPATLPQTNTYGPNYCPLSDATKFASPSEASPEGLRSQSVVRDRSPRPSEILTKDEACQSMKQLAHYFKDPCVKSSKVWTCLQDLLEALRCSPHSLEILTEDGACQIMTGLTKYFKDLCVKDPGVEDPGVKELEVPVCLQDLLKVLRAIEPN